MPGSRVGGGLGRLGGCAVRRRHHDQHADVVNSIFCDFFLKQPQQPPLPSSPRYVARADDATDRRCMADKSEAGA